MSSQFNTLIQAKSIASITPQQILGAGSPVFFDIMTSSDIATINRLIQAYSRIHAPTYGQPIPLSGLVSSGIGVKTILEPDSNEVRKIMAATVTNAGGAPITGTLTLGGVELSPFVVNPTSTQVVEITGTFASKLLPVATTVTTGEATDLTTSIASLLVVQ